MANPLRGEVSLPAGETSYTLRLSINAIVEVETLLDKSINEIIANLDPATVRLGTLRGLMWGALREHHPQLTLFDVGELISTVGADRVGEAVGEALRLAFPRPEGAATSNPPGEAGTTS